MIPRALLAAALLLAPAESFFRGYTLGYFQTPIQVLECTTTSANAPGQIWSLPPLNITPGPSNAFAIRYAAPAGPMCVDVPAVWIPGINATIVTDACVPSAPSQAFTYTSAGRVVNVLMQQCLTLAMDSNANGTQVLLANCSSDAGAGSQLWSMNASTGQIVSNATSPSGSPLCLDASTVWRPCSTPPFSTFPFCNASLPVDARVADLIARAPPNEKYVQLLNNAAGMPSMGIAPWNTGDFTHSLSALPMISWSVMEAGGTVIYPAATSTAQAFNASLFYAIGNRIGDEARSVYNTGNGVLVGWSPNINILRDPRWGRANEVPAEDPYLTSVYATQLVSGQQWGPNPPGAGYLKTVATCKHFAGYSLELWNGTVRYDFNAIIPARDLVGTYLPGFQACVQEARGAGLMCSYNAINGTPSCANELLMKDIARDTWGFDGYITSDCGAAKAVWQTYGYVSTPEQVCPATLNAGMDIGCNNDAFPPQCAALTIADGTLNASAIDTAVAHVFRLRMRTGEFDPPGMIPYSLLDNNTLMCTPDGFALARDAASQAMALLKVDRTRLPLSFSTIHSVAAVGPNANATFQLLGDYSGWPCHGVVPSLVNALDTAGLAVDFAFGCAINDSDTSGIAAAAAAAAGADATIVFAGMDLTVEREGKDRYQIGWPGVQAELISTVCAAARGPCVLVILGGGSIDISAQLADPNVHGIVWAGYPGIEAAGAIVDTLFGVSVPAGRLGKTLYPSSYVDEVSMFEFSMPAGSSLYPPGTSPGRTYRFYTGTPVLPFGFGLSYTNFTYSSALQGSSSTVSMAGVHQYLRENLHPKFNASYAPLTSPRVGGFIVNVTNMGSIDAADAVLGYLVPPGAGTDGIPVQYLFNFQRVWVPAGATVSVYLGLHARDLTQVMHDGARVEWPGTYTMRAGVQAGHQLGAGFAEVTFEAV